MNASEYAQRLKNTGRNDTCPCGSGKKYKICHLPEDEAARHEEMVKAAKEREAALASASEDQSDEDKAAAAKNDKKRRDDHRRASVKATSGTDRHTNIPRRGAV